MSIKIGAQEMRNIADTIKERIGDKTIGFALVTFDFGEGGITNYISNAKRDDMMKYFEELLNKWQSENELPTFEEN
jgi:coenzyme F420-reducing hydrogenase alpha subunit